MFSISLNGTFRYVKRSTYLLVLLIFKVVSCGKYINLNNHKNLTYLPEIYQTSSFCYFLQLTM